jgi:hypothetical protein
VWVALIVGLVLGDLYWGPGFLTDDWSWKWVDRASWTVAIIGLPLLVYQVAVLRREQVRKPSITFGVAVGDADVEPIRSSGPINSGAGSVAIQMAAKNLGSRTARHILFNYQLPENCPIESIQPSAGSGDFDRNRRLWQISVDHLHPDSLVVAKAEIVLVPGCSKGVATINVSATMDDFKEARSVIALTVAPIAPRPPATSTTR